MHTLERIDAIARECCRRLPLPSMLGKYGAAGAKTSINHPEKFTLVGAGASESTTNAATAIRATLTLMGDNVVQADVAIRCLCVCVHAHRRTGTPRRPGTCFVPLLNRMYNGSYNKSKTLRIT
jgi:hypothetical protein